MTSSKETSQQVDLLEEWQHPAGASAGSIFTNMRCLSLKHILFSFLIHMTYRKCSGMVHQFEYFIHLWNFHIASRKSWSKIKHNIYDTHTHTLWSLLCCCWPRCDTQLNDSVSLPLYFYICGDQLHVSTFRDSKTFLETKEMSQKSFLALISAKGCLRLQAWF